MKSLRVILKNNDLSLQQSSLLHCSPWYSVVWPIWKWREIIHGGGTLLEIVSSCWGNVWCNLGMFLIQALKGWENRTARWSRRAGYNWGKIGVSACTFLCVLQRGGKIWKFANIPFAHQCEEVLLLVYMAKICQIIFRCLRQQLPCSIDEPIKVLFPCELLSCWPTLWCDCTILHAHAIIMKSMVSLNLGREDVHQREEPGERR